MNKKTAYYAYYYSTVQDITSVQLLSCSELPSIDVSVVQNRMDEKDIYCMVRGEEDYHRRAQTIKPSPGLLYYQGTVSVLEKPTIAIVGPRKMTPYAQEVLEQLFLQLSHFDIVTVSGMAPGVDTLCHELSLRYHIPTIAILGGGFAPFLRGTKRELMERITQGGGLIMSEYKHSFLPTQRSFPQRNRIIAGMADVVFLPEATQKSGSLITADMAYEMHKPVYAPMHSIFVESSGGTNAYIAAGQITPLAEIGSFLEKHYTRMKQSRDERTESRDERTESRDIIENMTDEERKIVMILKERQTISLALLMEKSGYSSSEILGYVSMLEMKEIVVQKYPGVYTLQNNSKC